MTEPRGDALQTQAPEVPEGFRPHPPEVPRKDPDEPRGWMENPRLIRGTRIVAIVLVVGLYVADFFVHHHTNLGVALGETPIEEIPGFHLVFGAVVAALLVFLSKAVGSSLKRKEDYYDE